MTDIPSRPKPKKRTVIIAGLIVVAVAATVAVTVPLVLRGQSIADIRADSNRDGVVDVSGASDRADKSEWSDTRGAIFLPNIGDSAQRGRPSDPRNAGLSDADIAAIHDANDDVPRATENFAPLRTIPISGLDKNTTGTVQLAGPGREKARLFVQRAGSWEYVTADTSLTRSELTDGVTLGLDGRDVIRPGEWDGFVTVRFTVSQGLIPSTDEVKLRVAPVLTHNHVQDVDRVITAADSENPAQTSFVSELAERTRQFGQQQPIELTTPGDQWAQDFMEPGFVSMPGANGTVRSLRVIIRSPQTKREAGRQAFELRGPGVGAIQFSKGRRDEVNSMGNVETTPPFTLNGVTYPAGRIITGTHGKKMPASLDFFRAQGAQDPILLDTNWLGIGHVDEFVQFLPADNDRGWTIAVMDAGLGRDVIEKAQKAGHGATVMNSRPVNPDASASGFPAPVIQTIDQYLADDAARKANDSASKNVEKNLNILLKETGVTASEVVRIPALFEESGLFGGFDPSQFPPATDAPTDPSQAPPTAADDGSPALPDGRAGFFNDDRGPDDPDHGSTAAYVPAAINGIVIGRNYIAPQQWGPVVEGQDIFAAAVSAAYSRAGMTVGWVDDWESHHTMGGEVHCGTNTLRTTDVSWWAGASR